MIASGTPSNSFIFIQPCSHAPLAQARAMKFDYRCKRTLMNCGLANVFIAQKTAPASDSGSRGTLTQTISSALLPSRIHLCGVPSDGRPSAGQDVADGPSGRPSTRSGRHPSGGIHRSRHIPGPAQVRAFRRSAQEARRGPRPAQRMRQGRAWQQAAKSMRIFSSCLTSHG
jgi:hypothetical protein